MVYAVGIMSGTSLDGIDAALVDITGVNKETKLTLVAFTTVPFQEQTLQNIREALSVEESNVEKICSLNFELGYVFADAVKKVCRKAHISLDNLAFIGSHGQTIYHIPDPAARHFLSTLQIGDPAVICEETRTTVVSNFRERDMAVQGQGAPIVPYSEYLLFRSETVTRLLQNIGGIGNVTVLPRKGQLEDMIAFDTGPGNVIMNELCLHFFNEAYDKEGRHARSGTINEALLAELMTHPYIQKSYPKTTGREDFGKQFTMNLLENWTLSAEDWLATATMFTARSIAEAVTPFIDGQTELIVGGGGSYNQTLLQFLKSELPSVEVKTQEDLEESSEAKEAIAMVILANQTLNHQPSNVMRATGAKRAVPLGRVTYYQ